MNNRANGKMKPLKAPKKAAKNLTEKDIEFKDAQRKAKQEEEELKKKLASKSKKK
ncbi:hypothetical protein NEOKW01_0881 [Nematocida sp. AWRm80]|nr:hypothetical protein NEOKW01_0881 [Nematocida sp. AWRm80]